MKVPFNTLKYDLEKFGNDYINSISDVINSGNFILGRNVISFEQEFSAYLGSKYCVAVNSGLDALIFSLLALGIGKGDEVIVPANTYIATINAIVHTGADPILVDCDKYYNIDCTKIEEKLTNKTKALIVVHLYGQSSNMEEIIKIKDKYNFFLIEDCAQSHGTKFSKHMTGTFGEVGCFSFYPTKNLGGFGDGGAIVTDSKEIHDSILSLRNYGKRDRYNNELIGFNSRLDEIQAAILRLKLINLRESLLSRKEVAEYYLATIKNPLIQLPKKLPNSEHSWHLFVVSVTDRDDFIGFLSENGVGFEFHYPIPPHRTIAYEFLLPCELPLTEYFANHIVSLPLYTFMPAEHYKHVATVLNNYIK